MMKKLLSKYLMFFVILIIDLITIGLFLLGYFSNFAVVVLITFVALIIDSVEEFFHKEKKSKYTMVHYVVLLILELSVFIIFLKEF